MEYIRLDQIVAILDRAMLRAKVISENGIRSCSVRDHEMGETTIGICQRLKDHCKDVAVEIE